jgi:hypothetical protein
MWGSPDRSRGQEVTCIACGETVSRSNAREYDKYGNRWDRRDKQFEYLCKPCDRERCHQSRGGLETLLEDVEAESDGTDSFVATFFDLAERRDESVEER